MAGADALAKRQTTDLHKWATLGAGQRLRELREEITSIYRAFPGLRGTQGRSAKGSRGPRATGATAGGSGEVRPKRRRRKMSAEARKRISDAQKARWAKQRAEAATPSGARKKR
jgi:hypothetical protein